MGRLPLVVCRAIPVAAGAVASVSCAQIAGIDETRAPADSLVLVRRSIGADVVDSPIDVTGLRATYLVANATAPGFEPVDAVPGTQPGMWTTQLREPAPVEFTLPDASAPQLFAFPSSQLKVAHGVLEHPNPAPAPDGATFAVTVPLDSPIAAGESFQTYVVGAWLRRPFTATEAPVGTGTTTQIGPVSFGFTAADSVAGRPAPDRVTIQDAFLVLRYAGAGLTGFAEASRVDQIDMATAVTTATMATVVQDQQLNVKLSPGAFATRYMAVRPAVTGLAMSWSLVAAPGSQSASSAGPVLQSGTVMPNDLGVTAMYANPFVARWGTIFSLVTSESRTYTPAGTTTPVSLLAGMNQFIEPVSDGSPLTLPAGLPILAMLDDMALSTDGQTIPQPTRFVKVRIITDMPDGATAPGATLYDLQVFDLTPNQAGTVLERHLVLSAASNEPEFELPPETFQAGHRYTLRLTSTLGGYPELDGGDFTQRQLPLAQSYVDSAVIEVTP